MRALLLPLILLGAGCTSFKVIRERDELPRTRESVSLWSLAHEASNVVVADVAGVRNDAPLLGASTTTATLAVHAALKGQASGALEVAKRNYQLCGIVRHSATLLQGYRTVAFLTQSTSGWYPVQFRYPTSPDELADYAELIRFALDHDVGRRAPSREWILLAMSHRATRRDALVELSLSEQALTPAEFALIEAAFISKPSVDRALVDMIQLFEGRQSVALDAAIANAIDTMLAAGQHERIISEAIGSLERRLACSRNSDCTTRSRPRPSVDWAEVKAGLAPLPRGRCDRRALANAGLRPRCG